MSIYPIRMCQFDSVECVPSIGYLQFRNVHVIGGKNRGEPVTRKGYFEGSGLLIGFSFTISTVIGLCPSLAG